MLIAAQGLELRERAVGLNAQLHGTHADPGSASPRLKTARWIANWELLVEIRAQRLYAGE